jgi:hypothetical protein
VGSGVFYTIRPEAKYGGQKWSCREWLVVDIEVSVQASSTSQWWTDMARRQRVVRDWDYEELRK